jgi:hypothetical protein
MLSRTWCIRSEVCREIQRDGVIASYYTFARENFCKARNSTLTQVVIGVITKPVVLPRIEG